LSDIAVLGAGAWGSALALHLARLGGNVRLWGFDKNEIDAINRDRQNKQYLPDAPFPDNIECTNELQEALQDVDGVLIVVPSHAFREVLSNALPFLKEETRLAWATKGLDPEKNCLLSEVAQELMPGHAHFAIFSGPSFAREVADEKPTAIAMATEFEDEADFWQKHMHSDYFRIYSTTDIVGVQLGGSVKNILAIATGVAEGLGFGANTQAALITRGLSEMMRLGLASGAKQETFMGLAGMGDLILTCTGDLSRNRRFGKLLGQGRLIGEALKEVQQVVEGVQTTKLVHSFAQENNIDMPITEEMYEILYKNKSAKDAVKSLLERKPRAE
jgi:glycerol-3-phosphate dehydrogenase (NAD(P)+)